MHTAAELAASDCESDFTRLKNELLSALQTQTNLRYYAGHQLDPAVSSQQLSLVSCLWLWYRLVSVMTTTTPGLADLNQCDWNHWFQSWFKSIDFFVKKSSDL